MAIKLIIDAASDLTRSQAEQMGALLVPMPVTIGDRQYLAGVDISPADFYELLVETDSMPVTSQPSPAVFEETFRKVTDAGDKGLVITISSKLSGTYQSACIAAGEFPERICVVDSMNAAVGETILAEYAKRLIDAGEPLSVIADRLEKAKKRIRLIALLNNLEYLKKGGRISPAAAAIGSMLSIKPVIAIENGEVKIVGKARGSKQGNNFLNETIRRDGGIDFDMPYSLAYTGLSDALLKKYVNDSRALWAENTDTLPVLVIGAAIGTHVGPGAIAVAYFTKEE